MVVDTKKVAPVPAPAPAPLQVFGSITITLSGAFTGLEKDNKKVFDHHADRGVRDTITQAVAYLESLPLLISKRDEQTRADQVAIQAEKERELRLKESTARESALTAASPKPAPESASKGTTPPSIAKTAVEKKTGTLPADFPGRDVLVADDIDTYEELDKWELETLPGITPELVTQITEALK